MKTRRKSKNASKGRTKIRNSASRSTRSGNPRPMNVKAPSFVIDAAPRQPVKREPVAFDSVVPVPPKPLEPPRFVINTAPKETAVVTKSKYVDISQSEKLQVFLDLACYVDEEEFGFVYIDVSHPDNQDRAADWFEDDLTFLGRRDADELTRIWQRAIDDGGSARILFNAVNYLKEKYGDL